MPSPFPGMDPYLEDPAHWPDFHEGLAGEIRSALNQNLPPAYYARLDMRLEVGAADAEEDDSYVPHIFPDVVVAESRERGPRPQGGIALLDASRTEISESFELTVHSERAKHVFVEIRDSSRQHRLVTLIEILSPTNKRQGQDRFLYEKKFEEVFASDASIIEIDLLRGGERILHHQYLYHRYAQFEPKPDYLILVNRSWIRSEPTKYQFFAIMLRQMLPCIGVPLREGEPETPLDLQYVMNRVYDTGPYRRGAVDYSRPAVPALSAADARWAEEVLRSLRTPSVSASGA